MNSQSTLIFLTTLNKGRRSGAVHDVRQHEALKAGKYINKFQRVKIIFFNREVFDGSVHSDFTLANFKELTQIVVEEEPDELITLCFEAGHQDHDSVELIVRIISENLNLKMRCFSGYRASAISPKLFSVLKPITRTEEIFFSRFFLVRVSIRLMLIYKSQVKTWLGLAPILLFKYAFLPFWEGGRSPFAYQEKVSNCFYENRGRASQNEVLLAHQKFVRDFASKGL